jgi:DNA-3-methyladenine glycosylase II
MTLPDRIILTANSDSAIALTAADPQLGMLIDRVGRVDVPPPGEPFEELVGSIVAQQLSEKVARTIWNRVIEVAEPTPAGFAAASFDDLRAAGLSRAKVDYVQGIARSVLAGDIDLSGLSELTDEDAVTALVALRGVGRWTAEMFLIFALRRPDVLAVDDFGIRDSAGRMAGLDRAFSRDELATRGALWQPHRTAASLWLWADRA